LGIPHIKRNSVHASLFLGLTEDCRVFLEEGGNV
jgi:hypothetical protein